MLFVTKTCPNCKIAKQLLDAEGIEYNVIFAEENIDLAKKFGIIQAPTMVVENGDGFEKYAGAAAIKQFVATAKVKA